MNEFKIALNEVTFTNVCKMGFIQHHTNETGTTDIFLNKNDIMKLFTEKGIVKTTNSKFDIRVFNINDFTMKEIIRRSPIFSDIYEEIK